MTQIAVFICVG